MPQWWHNVNLCALPLAMPWILLGPPSLLQFFPMKPKKRKSLPCHLSAGIAGIAAAFSFSAFAAELPEDQQTAIDAAAKTYYAELRGYHKSEKSATDRNLKAMWDESTSVPSTATGLVLDRWGRPVPGATIVLQKESDHGELESRKTEEDGKFRVEISEKKYRGLDLIVTAPGFARWAQGSIYGGLENKEVRLDQEIDAKFIAALLAEKDFKSRCWMLLEIIGRRQSEVEIEKIYPDIGKLRSDLLAVISSHRFEDIDVSPERNDDARFDNSPSRRAIQMLSYWCDSNDGDILKAWLQGQGTLGKARAQAAPPEMSAPTIDELCALWREHHFKKEKIEKEKRPPSSFSKPIMGAGENRALVDFQVTYAHWGYSDRLVLVKDGDQWRPRFVVDWQLHWFSKP